VEIIAMLRGKYSHKLGLGLLVTILVTALLAAPSVAGRTSALQAEVKRPACPIKPAPGLTIVDFEGRLLSSDSARSRTASQAVDLPKGTYTVRLVGWDGYTGREKVSQPNEKYKVVLTGNDYSRATNAHSDVPDNLREALVNEVVHNANFVLEQNVTSLQAVHAVYPDKSSPNSLEPICAAFQRIPDPEPLVCDSLHIEKVVDRTIKAIVKYTANDAKFKSASFDFGDGSNVVTTDKTTVEHTYAKDGAYYAEARINYTLNSKDQVAKSANCKQKVEIETPAEPQEVVRCDLTTGEIVTITEEEAIDTDQYGSVDADECQPVDPVEPAEVLGEGAGPEDRPAELPVTGPASIFGLFTATTVAGSAAHYLFNRRRV
jgi:hypothetical protein